VETSTTARTNINHQLHWCDFLWALGTLCSLRDLPFDGELFVRRIPPPYTIRDFITALYAHGIRVRETAIESLQGPMTFPCIVFQRTERGGIDDAPSKIALIAKCDRRHALAINCLSKGTFAVPFALLNEVFEPLVLYFAVA
jgi:hypothetical protein